MMKIMIPYIIVGVVALLIGAAIYAAGKRQSISERTKVVNGKVEITVGSDEHILGNKNAPVTIVEYSDFQCPYCVVFHPTLKKIVSEFPGQVRWVYRYYPLPSHRAAKNAAYAAEAAGMQGKFWEYADLLSEHSQPDGGGLAQADLDKYAEKLGLNMSQFHSDQVSAVVRNRIETDVKSGNDLGVLGTPTAYIIDKNSKMSEPVGAISYEELKAKVLEALSL